MSKRPDYPSDDDPFEMMPDNELRPSGRPNNEDDEYECTPDLLLNVILVACAIVAAVLITMAIMA